MKLNGAISNCEPTEGFKNLWWLSMLTTVMDHLPLFARRWSRMQDKTGSRELTPPENREKWQNVHIHPLSTHWLYFKNTGGGHTTTGSEHHRQTGAFDSHTTLHIVLKLRQNSPHPPCSTSEYAILILWTWKMLRNLFSFKTVDFFLNLRQVI